MIGHVLAGALLAAPGVLILSAGTDAAPAEPLERDRTPVCQLEDSPGRCVWDARHNGNGNGSSFIRRESGAVVYVTHRRAHRLAETNR